MRQTRRSGAQRAQNGHCVSAGLTDRNKRSNTIKCQRTGDHLRRTELLQKSAVETQQSKGGGGGNIRPVQFFAWAAFYNPIYKSRNRLADCGYNLRQNYAVFNAC